MRLAVSSNLAPANAPSQMCRPKRSKYIYSHSTNIPIGIISNQFIEINTPTRKRNVEIVL